MPLAYKRWGRGGGVRAATFRPAPRPQALRRTGLEPAQGRTGFSVQSAIDRL